MTNKEIAAKVAVKTGHSESHILHVLAGRRFNAIIEDAIIAVQNAKTKPAAPKVEAVAPSNADIQRLNSNQVGDLLKAIRESRGWSQEKLANEMGVSRSTVSAAETNSEKTSLKTFFQYLTAAKTLVDFRLTMIEVK